jgi:hypothetical protein
LSTLSPAQALSYRKERNLSVFFSRYIIPASCDGYPCVRGAETRYPGYFVVATTLNQDGPVRPDGLRAGPLHRCRADSILRAPGAELRTRRSRRHRRRPAQARLAGAIAYGIAADTGPFDQFGEGSIAFNQKLLGRSDLVMNSKNETLRGHADDSACPDRFRPAGPDRAPCSPLSRCESSRLMF